MLVFCHLGHHRDIQILKPKLLYWFQLGQGRPGTRTPGVRDLDPFISSLSGKGHLPLLSGRRSRSLHIQMQNRCVLLKCMELDYI